MKAFIYAMRVGRHRAQDRLAGPVQRRRARPAAGKLHPETDLPQGEREPQRRGEFAYSLPTGESFTFTVHARLCASGNLRAQSSNFSRSLRTRSPSRHPVSDKTGGSNSRDNGVTEATKTTKSCSPQVKERGVRMVLESTKGASVAVGGNLLGILER